MLDFSTFTSCSFAVLLCWPGGCNCRVVFFPTQTAAVSIAVQGGRVAGAAHVVGKKDGRTLRLTERIIFTLRLWLRVVCCCDVFYFIFMSLLLLPLVAAVL